MTHEIGHSAEDRSDASGDTESTLLFVDDHEVLYRAGTRIRLEPATRCAANPLVSGYDRPWEGLLGWSSAHFDPSTEEFRLWYQAFLRGVPASDPRSSVVCVVNSSDGVEWRRPELDFYPHEGKGTNIVMVGNSGHSYRYGANVFEDPQRILGDRFIMAHYDFGVNEGHEFPGLFLAHSHDGYEWETVPGGPFVRTAYGMRGEELPVYGAERTAADRWSIPLSMSDATDLFFDDDLGRYVWYGKLWLDGPDGRMGWKHGIGMTSSSDLLHWDTPGVVLWPDDLDPDYVEFHTGSVFRCHGVYFCLLQLLHREEDAGVVDVELAVSRDGIRWERRFRDERFVRRGDPGEFDAGAVLTNSTPVFLPEETRLYYGAYSTGATGTLGVKEPITSGIGFASIRKDRFASIASSDGPGQITLKPRRLSPGTRIAVNADAGHGSVRIGLLDRTGYRLPGFGPEACVPIHDDTLFGEVAWKDASIAELPADREIMIRVHLDDARIYALYLTGA